MKEKIESILSKYTIDDGTNHSFDSLSSDLFSVFAELLRERNELAAHVERLRCAANKLSFGLVHDEPEWKPSEYTNKAFSELQDVCAETPAQSLDAIKQEASGDAINKFLGCIDVEMQYNEKVIDAIPLALKNYNNTL